MALSIGIIIIGGLLLNKLFSKLRLPGLIGMILLGIVIGPHCLNLISSDVLTISSDLRRIALIIILLRAGLGIKKNELKKVGATAMKMSMLPCIFEGFAIMFAAKYLLGFSFVEGGMLGFVIAAVSPAVIVPQMLWFVEKKRGEEKNIPTLILTSSSIDDVFAITLFSTFLGFYSGENINILYKILGIPVSIILGTVVGFIIGCVLVWAFKKFHFRDSEKILILLCISIFFVTIEDITKDIIPIASLLGVMVIGFIMLQKYNNLANRISLKLNKLWVAAEIILFVLVGAEVDISLIFNIGFVGIIILLMGLIARSIGVYISLMGSDLSFKERLFCIVSFIPKATVQAAMGGVPLACGVASGSVILSISVLAILITAPLGAIGIRNLGEKWL